MLEQRYFFTFGNAFNNHYSDSDKKVTIEKGRQNYKHILYFNVKETGQ